MNGVDIPVDCLVTIMEFLPKADLLKSASGVCNEWRFLSMLPFLWHDYDWNTKGISFICSFCCQYGPWMRNLSFTSSNIITDSVLNQMMRHLEELHELHLRDCSSITDFQIDVSDLVAANTTASVVEQETATTTKRNKKKSFFDTEPLVPIPHHIFTHLTKLSLVKTKISVPSLRSLLMSCCQTLEHLHLEDVSFKMSDAFTHRRTSAKDPVRYIELPRLESFILGGYNTKKIASTEVDMLVEHTCPNIHTLEIRGIWLRETNHNYVHFLSGLKRWKRLKTFCISQSTITFKLTGQNFFERLPHNLTELRLMNEAVLIDKNSLGQYLQRCTELRVIQFNHVSHFPFHDYCGVVTATLINAPTTFKELLFTMDTSGSYEGDFYRRWPYGSTSWFHVNTKAEFDESVRELARFTPRYQLQMVTPIVTSLARPCIFQEIMKLSKYNSHLPREVRHKFVGGSEYLL